MSSFRSLHHLQHLYFTRCISVCLCLFCSSHVSSIIISLSLSLSLSLLVLGHLGGSCFFTLGPGWKRGVERSSFGTILTRLLEGGNPEHGRAVVMALRSSTNTAGAIEQRITRWDMIDNTTVLYHCLGLTSRCHPRMRSSKKSSCPVYCLQGLFPNHHHDGFLKDKE